VLTIKGETEAEEEVERDAYICQECRYGSFSRSVSLPPGLKTDKAEATYENGVLTVTVPKSQTVKPRAVKVKAQGKAKAERVVKTPAKSRGRGRRKASRRRGPSAKPTTPTQA
jgi:hypothetical protein